MNKIYKVVWSKVKHCYVVTSELAKRQTKGCGARSLRMATVSLGVAASLLCSGAVLPIFGESVAEAASEDVSNKTVDITSDTSKKIYGSWAGFSTTDTSNAIWGGFSTESTVDTNYNAVTIGNVTVSGNTVSGGWNMRTGSSTGNSVTVNSGTVHGQVVGGYGWSGNDIKDNSVIVNAGTVNNGINGANGYGTLSGNKVFINPGSTVKDIIGAHHPNYNTYSKIDDNRVSVSGSTVNGSVTGGWISMTATYDNPVTNNKVEITDSEVSGAVNGGGYGGDSYSDNADVEIISGNTVKLTNSKVNNGVRAGATRVASGLIKNNTVELESTDVLGNVWGGYNLGYYDGKAIATLSENKVTMNGGTVGTASASPADEYAEGVVYGAYSVSSSVNTGDVTGNTVTIKSGTVGNTVQAVIGGFTRATGSSGNSGKATGNTVTIEGGTIKGIVRGGASMSSQKTAGEVKENNVIIKGGKFETTYIINRETNPVTVTSYRSDVYGGYLEGDGNSGVVQDNTVTISGGDFTSAKIYGGYSNASNAVHNTVEFTKDFTAPERNFITVAGGASISGNAIKNVVAIGGGNIGRYEYNVYGGYSETGTAGGAADEGNTVTITGGKVEGSAVGGFSKSGAVKNNVVTVSGSETEVSDIRGGSSWTGTVSENTATIQGGWVSYAYGGFSSYDTANGNKLNISGGKVGGGVYGGDAPTTTYNAVTISGDAEINTPYLTGGRSYATGGVATGNTFTISGGIFSRVAESSYAIVGGFTDGNGTAKDNAVNLTGEVTGLENFELYGYEHAATHSGNELHIGGTKTYESNGTASVSGGAVWQGKSSDGTVNNKVESVSNFESIVLHNVAWSKTLPVLEATSVNNVGTLDIKDLKFDQTPTSGSMALLKSESILGVGGVGIGLAYKDGSTEKTATSAELATATGVTFDSGALVDSAVGGVTLTGTQSKKVSLEDEDKTIMYSFSSSVDGITIATDTFTADGTARTFGKGVTLTGATITNNLAFSDESKKNMASGTSMVILDAIEAVAVSGATLPTFDATTYDVDFSDAIDSKVVTLNGKHTDTLAMNDTTARTQLIYTVGDKNVETATFNGAVDFSTGDAYYTADSQYKFSATNVDAKNLTFNETTEALTKDSSMTLLSATGLTAGTITQPDTPTVAINYGGDATNGITFNAVATGSVAVESGAVKFKVNAVEAETIDLSNWNGTTTDVSTATSGWTLKAGETVETGDLAKADLSDLKPGDTKTILIASDSITFTDANITGSKKWQAGGAIDDSSGTTGVKIATGTTTGGGVKVNADNAHQLIYEMSKDSVTAITLGSVAYTKGGTVRAFGNSYDLTNAEITIADSSFSLSNLEAVKDSMNTGDTMVVVDATNAIKATGEETKTLKDFTTVNAGNAIAFTDQIEGKALTLSGTHQDTLEQNEAKNQILYKVGDKNVNQAIFTGEVTWNDSEVYYTNDTTKYKFAATNVNAEALIVTGTTTKALKTGDAMTLLSAKNMTPTIATDQSGTNKTASKITVNYSDTASGIAIGAEAAGQVKAATGAVNYEVIGVSLNSVDLTNWNGTAADLSTGNTSGWTLSTGATITTGDLADAGLDTMNAGDVKTILTAADTIAFTNDMISGAKKWQDGDAIDDSSDTSGVTITAGTTTGGGVKVNETNTSQLVYQKDKKNVTGITLGKVTFNTAKAAREFGNAYDLTAADIDATNFKIKDAETAAMNAGEEMIVLDATKAIKGTGTATLKDFDTKSMTPIDFSDAISGTVLKFIGKHTDTLEQNSEQTQIIYKVGDKNVETVTLNGSVTWNDSKTYYTNDASKYKIGATNVNVENLIVTGTTTKALKADGSSSMTLLSSENMTATIATDQSATNKTASKVSVSYKDGQGVAFAAEAKGAVATEPGAVKYKINEVKLTDVDLSAWTGSESSVPDTWTAEDGSVKVATGSFAEPDVAIGSARTILTAGSAFFADDNISGANKYDEANGKAFSETQNNVTVSGTQAKGVATADEGKSLVYKVDIKKADTVSLGATNWQKDAVLFDGSSATEYDYGVVTAIGTDKFDVAYAAPEKVAVGESMTLLKANETLTAIVNEEKAKAYSFTPVSGVTVDAAITGKLANSGNNVVFTAAANQASKLTFGDVEWKDSGALLTRPRNITFAGADVDTSRINFTNMIYLDADRQMTLVSDFGDKVGTITGSKYLVGTAFEGEGAASLSGSDLVFRTKTGAGVSEQTHKTVMATEVGVTMLNTGNDYIDKAMEGMGDLANVAPDGTTVGAAIGGGRNRYETGSHVNVNSWNAAVAVGAKRELKNGSLEYGVFGEYGKANFTLHSDAGKGDGDSHYAGGGLLAKWTNKHDVYTEAGFRLGRLSESSSDIMRDGLGNTYGYDVHANYFGAHVGVGKIFRYKGGKSLDVYGKYFYTKRDGVEFDAVQHYNLDSVSSSVLRVGARYGTTDKKWNWYGGLAYEYEFDGEAEGVVNGVAIRAASIKGSSVRGEIGMRMEATKTNPWQMDISLYGYGGKHRGFGGNVNVAYMF